MKKLTSVQIKAALKQVPLWGIEKGLLERIFMFKDFDEAFVFVNKVAKLARKDNHHPNIEIRYHKVILKLRTNDIGGLTRKDFAMAQGFDNIL